MTNFDGVLKQVGEFGKAQIFFYVLVGFCGIPVGMQSLSSVFVAGAQNFWCSGASFNDTPPSNNDTCEAYSAATSLQGWQSNASDVCNQLHFDTSQYTSTLLSQFQLVCNRKFLVSLTTTMYMCGVLVGCTVFGIISDSIGRLKALVLSATLMITFAVLAAVVPNFFVHVVCRIITGACAMGCFTTAFVIAMEIIGPKCRMAAGIMMQAWFAVGFVILTGTAYFVRSHVVLQLVIALPSVFLLSYYWLLPESPRWLIVNGRYQEAHQVVHKIARMNGKPMLEDSALDAMLKPATATKSQDFRFIDILRMPNLRKRSLNIFFSWFVNAFVFYGLSLGVGSLGGNVYLNALMSGLVEQPAYILCINILDRAGRVKPMTVLFFIGGVSCLACTFLLDKPDLSWLLVTFAMIGKFAISATFAIIYVYTAEVFPTVIRNIAVGVSSTCARIGAILAPQVVLTEVVWAPLPFLIYGSFPIIAGLLCLLLPETLDQELPETIEDGENFGIKQRNNADELDKELCVKNA